MASNFSANKEQAVIEMLGGADNSVLEIDASDFKGVDFAPILNSWTSAINDHGASPQGIALIKFTTMSMCDKT
jgi:hypothetical protein